MSDAEREEEARELKERFGPGLEALMRSRRQKRLEAESATRSKDSPVAASPMSDPDTSAAVRSDDTTPTESDNTARIAAMSPAEREQEIAKLQERFGSATIDALRQRAAKKAGASSRSSVTKPACESCKSPASGSTLNHYVAPKRTMAVEEDLSQADLKAKYFPDLPSEPDKLAWMTNPAPGSADDSAPRFDLSGRQLSARQTQDLPSDIGLHHHGASPDLAGYTLDEILHLCQSTVPSQRITMMSVLARIITAFQLDEVSDEVKYLINEKRICEHGLKMAVSGILLMSKSAGIFRAAVELFYESLGGSRWTWTDSHDTTPFQPTETHVDLAGVAWEDIVPTFGEMLDTDSLAPRTTTQILRVLRRLAALSDEHCELVTPLLPQIIRTHVVMRPWPATASSSPPSDEVLALMRDAIATSRRCAAALVDQSIVEPLLKFPLTLTWHDTPLGRELARISIDTLTGLARYGLATSIAKSGTEPLDRLRDWLKAADAPDLATSYIDLLTVWTVCATDPHKTTPEHDLTWAQVSAMGWVDDVLDLSEKYLAEARWQELSAALSFLATWLEGAEINEVERGAEDKRKVSQRLQSIDVARTLLDLGSEAGAEPRLISTTLSHVVRLHMLAGSLLSVEQSKRLVGDDHYFKDAQLGFQSLRLAQREKMVEPSTIAGLAFDLVPRLQPGSEPLALDLVDTLLRNDYAAHFPAVSILPEDGLQILRPLLHYTVLPDLTNVVGPTQPLPEYLKATSTLRPSPRAASRAKREPGLPLPVDWMFSPLNELLHSATSIALAQTPPDWDPSELDLVRATLMLTELHRIYGDLQAESSRSPSVLLLNLMKVFMLEHGQQTPTNHSETDLFRDPTISTSIASLLGHTLFTPGPSADSCVTSLEDACIAFLGPDTPFFQWYTDFVSLYESVSFGDHAFTQLLLPPLAMSYPVDYRRLFWGEHTSILRGIKLQDADIPLESAQGLDAFFSPIETDQAVLDGMIRAAARDWLRPDTFLRRVATHHLAANAWEEGSSDEDRKRVLMGVLSTCPDAFVKEIMLHSGDAGNATEAEMDRRKKVVEQATGSRGLQRLDKLGL